MLVAGQRRVASQARERKKPGSSQQKNASLLLLNATIDIDIPPRVDEKEYKIDETNRIYTSI